MKAGGNWYAYCGNDPINRIDPNGYVYTEWDRNHGINKTVIDDATAAWTKAHDNKDTDGMRGASISAASERKKYMAADEVQTSSGYVVKKSNGSSSLSSKSVTTTASSGNLFEKNPYYKSSPEYIGTVIRQQAKEFAVGATTYYIGGAILS